MNTILICKCCSQERLEESIARGGPAFVEWCLVRREPTYLFIFEWAILFLWLQKYYDLDVEVTRKDGLILIREMAAEVKNMMDIKMNAVMVSLLHTFISHQYVYTSHTFVKSVKKYLQKYLQYERGRNWESGGIHMAASRIGSAYLLDPIISKGIGFEMFRGHNRNRVLWLTWLHRTRWRVLTALPRI
jgi:hypothetical protein